MFKKLFSVFRLEDKLAHSLAQAKAQSDAEVAAIQKRITAGSDQLDRLEMTTNERLSRIEVLFAPELTGKELARDNLIKAMRLDARK